jgi:hypothetical protein
MSDTDTNDALPPVLEYTGEFGPELVLFLPFIRHLAARGELRGRTVRTYKGMQPFYEGLGIERFEEKQTSREWVPPENRPAWLPVRDEHEFDGVGRPAAHDYPDPRAQFASVPLPDWLEERIALKPLLVIHNKYNDEWLAGPVNFFDLRTLRHAFDRLGDRFTIVYIRHGMRQAQANYVADDNSFHQFGDAALLARYPDVVEFDALFQGQQDGGVANVNAFKAALYSRCYRFLTSQGGGAHQIAQYSGSVMVIMHRHGWEKKWAYSPGYYTFMADPAPTLLVCTRQHQARRALDALGRATLDGGRLVLDPADAGLARQLDPRTILRRTRLEPFRLKIARKRLLVARKLGLAA